MNAFTRDIITFDVDDETDDPVSFGRLFPGAEYHQEQQATAVSHLTVEIQIIIDILTIQQSLEAAKRYQCHQYFIDLYSQTLAMKLDELRLLECLEC